MRYIVTIEASHQRGMGHLFRGLALARGIRQCGAEPVMVINDDDRSIGIIEQENLTYKVVRSFQDGIGWEDPIIDKYAPSWWINDRLDTTHAHATRVVRHGIHLATFDDHGEGAALAEYNVLAMDLIPSRRSSNALYGPQYIVLDPVIEQLRAIKPDRLLQRNVLLTLGGSDTYGATPRALASIGAIPGEHLIRVVIGPHFRHCDELARAVQLTRGNVTVFENVPSLLRMMSAADIVICGGGVTLFEAAALGVPAVSIANEPHELPVIQWFEANGFSINAGSCNNDFGPAMAQGVTKLLRDDGISAIMSENGRQLVDGRGLQRILNRLGCVHA